MNSKKTIKPNNQKKAINNKRGKQKMPTDPFTGKYIANDDVTIDAHSFQISDDMKKALMSNTATQMDIYQLQHSISDLSDNVKKIVSEVNKLKKSFNDKHEEGKCEFVNISKATMPKIASKVTHEIVNGKFDKIANILKEMNDWQISHSQILSEYKEEQKQEFKRIHDNIVTINERASYVFGKTIYGWFGNRYKEKAFSTIMVGSAIAIFSFLILLRIFDVNVVSEIFNGMLNFLRFVF